MRKERGKWSIVNIVQRGGAKFICTCGGIEFVYVGTSGGVGECYDACDCLTCGEPWETGQGSIMKFTGDTAYEKPCKD